VGGRSRRQERREAWSCAEQLPQELLIGYSSRARARVCV
jgi:hypothetical protein